MSAAGSPRTLSTISQARSHPTCPTFHGTIRVHRGELWWADVPGDKRRPVLILTRERFIPRLNSLLVAPATTTVRGIPTELALDPSEGVPVACAVSFDNTFTLAKASFVERITSLPEPRLAEACQAYRFAAGC